MTADGSRNTGLNIVKVRAEPSLEGAAARRNSLTELLRCVRGSS